MIKRRGVSVLHTFFTPSSRLFNRFSTISPCKDSADLAYEGTAARQTSCLPDLPQGNCHKGTASLGTGM